MDLQEQTRQNLKSGTLTALRQPDRPLTRRQQAHLQTLTELNDERAGWLGVKRLGARSFEAPHLIRRGEAVAFQDQQGLLVGIHPHTCRPMLAADPNQLAEMSAYFDQQYADTQRLSFRIGWMTNQLSRAFTRALPIALLAAGLLTTLYVHGIPALNGIVDWIFFTLAATLGWAIGVFFLIPAMVIPLLFGNVLFEMFALQLEESYLRRKHTTPTP